MAHLQLVTALTLSGALLWGMSLALLGSLKLALARRLQLAHGPTGKLHTIFNLILAPLMLLAGLLVDHQGIRLMVILGSVLLSGSLFALTTPQTANRGFVILLGAAFGMAAASTATLLLMPAALLGAEATAASLNLGLVFVALGALLTPPLIDVLLEQVGLRRSLAMLALLALVPAFLAAITPEDQLPVHAHPGAATTLPWGPMGLAALVFFFYAPLEAMMAARSAGLALPPPEAVAANAEGKPLPAPTARALAGHPAAAGLFWLVFVTSRLGFAWLQTPRVLGEEWDGWIVVLACLLAAVAIGNLAGAPSNGRMRVGLVLLGLLLAPVVPTTLALVFHHIAPTESGAAYGALFAAGSLGSLLFSPLVHIEPNQPALRSLRPSLLVGLALTGAALVFCLVVGL